ncbi:MAG: hypothetical protein LBC99_02760 [Spirochaetota bacterium]|jgi:hypothetical protein|nr:hypothetical protein [Spirochaetota bacterium]
MTAIQKVIRRILLTLTGIAGLILVALAAGTVYYLATRLHPWDFIAPLTTRVLIAENGIMDPLLSAVHGQFRGIRSLCENLERVAAIHPSLRQILVRLEKRVLMAETINGRGILIADTGWHSLFLPGGGLAVRSIFNPEGSARFSAREENTAGVAYIVYGISPSSEEETFHIALLGNILLVAEDAAAIAAAIQTSRASDTRVPWKMLAEAFSGENLRILYAPGHSPVYIPGRERLNLTGIGSALSLRIDARKSARVFIRSFFDPGTGDGQGAGRMLRSNQYHASRVLPDGLESYTTLLFDDMQELIQLAGNLGAEDFEMRDTETAGIHDWAATEIAFFSRNRQNFVRVTAQNASRACAALERSSAPDCILENRNTYRLLRARLPGFMRAFTPFAAWITQLGYCVQQKSVFTFGETPESLKELISPQKKSALPEEFLSLANEKANLLLFSKGVCAFFPGSLSIAQASGLDGNKMHSFARIRLTRGEIQSEILLAEY